MPERKAIQRPAEGSQQPAVAIREPTHAEIQQRAYFRYVERGRHDGFDQDDWCLAETELRGGGQLAIRQPEASVWVPQLRASGEAGSQTPARRPRSGARPTAG